MTIAGIVGFVGIVIAGIEGVAQSTPNFAGSWTPVPGRAVPDAPDGVPVKITQDGAVISIAFGSAPAVTYRLDGSKTTRQEKEDGAIRTITCVAKWLGPKLMITEESGPRKREFAYAFEEGGTGLLVVTRSTTLLHTRGGALTVSTIGPMTRVYRKSQGSAIPKFGP